MIEFFDRHGMATAFCDGQSIYLWDGRPVAYLLDEKVFAFSGRFIGWLSDGWIIDEDGKCLLFESDAVSGPRKTSAPGKASQKRPVGPAGKRSAPGSAVASGRISGLV